jgi:hypothetical protein
MRYCQYVTYFEQLRSVVGVNELNLAFSGKVLQALDYVSRVQVFHRVCVQEASDNVSDHEGLCLFPQTDGPERSGVEMIKGDEVSPFLDLSLKSISAGINFPSSFLECMPRKRGSLEDDTACAPLTELPFSILVL